MGPVGGHRVRLVEAYELVDIDVKEKSVGVLGGESLISGGNLLARSAPDGVKRIGRETSREVSMEREGAWG